jgi:tetratricopeptide (TPR) repeat protein
MQARAGRAAFAALASFLWLNGCGSSSRLAEMQKPGTAAAMPAGADAGPSPTGGVPTQPADLQADDTPNAFPGKEPNDDLGLGKKYFRSANFGLAERHFRRAVERHPRDLESWIGLAASYDRLRRWDLADRAYDQALAIAGPTAEILNNRGYSYMLRGEYRRARATLLQAHALDPANPYIKNNLELLEASVRNSRGIE